MRGCPRKGLLLRRVVGQNDRVVDGEIVALRQIGRALRRRQVVVADRCSSWTGIACSRRKAEVESWSTQSQQSMGARAAQTQNSTAKMNSLGLVGALPAGFVRHIDGDGSTESSSYGV